MKIAALTSESTNIGDDVQTIAVEQHLPRVGFYVRREDLKTYDGPECQWPKPLDISAVKERLRADLRGRIETALAQRA